MVSEQETTNQTMAQAADEISLHFEEAMKMVGELKECVEIHASSDVAGSEIRDMLEASDRTMDTISEGSDEIHKLKEPISSP